MMVLNFKLDGGKVEELEINLVACFALARWDTREQATDVCKELIEDTGKGWVVLAHHRHFHVIHGGYHHGPHTGNNPAD